MYHNKTYFEDDLSYLLLIHLSPIKILLKKIIQRKKSDEQQPKIPKY